jgi:hypothetical protein
MNYGPARIRYERRKRRRQKLQAWAGVWNVLSVLFGIATVILGAWFIWKFLFQGTPIKNIEPTITSLATIQHPTETEATIHTSIPTVQVKKTPIVPVPLLPTVEDETNFTFDLQAKPESISATLFKQDRTCNWMGIAGQAFDLQGRSVPGITVQVSGPMYGKDIQFLSMTGSAPLYGTGGYEIFLTDKPMDTRGEYQVRLVDQNGRGLSPRFTFDTSSDCSKNLVIVNFKQIK